MHKATAPHNIVFKGYEDLANFWGIELEPHTMDIDPPIPDRFMLGEVLFLSDETDDQEITRHCVKDCQVLTITLGSDTFEIMAIVGESFNSCLFLASDYNRLMKYNPLFLFIENK